MKRVAPAQAGVPSAAVAPAQAGVPSAAVAVKDLASLDRNAARTPRASWTAILAAGLAVL